MLVNILSALPLICVIFWLAAVLLDRNRIRVRQRSAFYLLFGELLIFHLILLLQINTPACMGVGGIMLLYFLDTLFSPLLFPILNFFVKSLTHKNITKFSTCEWLQFIPACVLTILTAVLGIYLFRTYSVDHLYDWFSPFYKGKNIAFQDPYVLSVFVLFYIVLGIQAISTVIYSFVSLHKYAGNLAQEVADFDVSNFFNMRRMVICIGLLASWGLLRYLFVLLDPESSMLWPVYALVHTVLLYIGCNWFVQIYYTANDFTLPNDTEKSCEVKVDNTNVVDDKLNGLIEEWFAREDKPYLKNGLKIADMADDINVSARHLSNYINSQYGQSFNLWINSHRIEYAKKLMLQDKKISIVELAFQCGFYDAASFSHMFKKLEGVTPKQWLSTNI